MGVFKLGKMTFGSLFKKPETVMYPIQTKPQPKGLKGHIAIEVDQCILCGMCDRSCSTDCITVDKAGGKWVIDRYACVQCGYCVTVCPKKCLRMDPDYAPASTKRDPEEFEVPVQQKPAAKKPEPAAVEKSATSEKAHADAQTKQGEQPRLQEDADLQRLIDLMDDEGAAKVKIALSFA